MTKSDAPAADQNAPRRREWVKPRLERASVAERTNKKNITPSDGGGLHVIS